MFFWEVPYWVFLFPVFLWLPWSPTTDPLTHSSHRFPLLKYLDCDHALSNCWQPSSLTSTHQPTLQPKIVINMYVYICMHHIYIHIYQVSKQCRMQIETYLTRLDLTTNLSLKGSVSKARNGCTPSNPSRRRARRRCQPKRERRKRLSTWRLEPAWKVHLRAKLWITV